MRHLRADLCLCEFDMSDAFVERATFYFSDEQLANLEILMLRLRTEQRVRAGKSELMRLAFDQLLAEPIGVVALALGGEAE